MGDAHEPHERTDFERIVRLFTTHGVEFVVIGGQAEALFGSARVTYDSYFCYRRTPENLVRLAGALVPLKPTLRGAPPGLPFRLDARTLQAGCNFTFDTTAGKLDLLGYVEPLGEYDRLASHRETYPLDDVTVHTIALEDLIAVKKHISRSKDRDSLLQLLAIRELRKSKADDDRGR